MKTLTAACLLCALAAITLNAAEGAARPAIGTSAVLFFRFGTFKEVHDEMEIKVTNTSGKPAGYALEFLDAKGNALEVPLAHSDKKADAHKKIDPMTRASGNLAASETTEYRTASQGHPFHTGWMRVIANPAESIRVEVAAQVFDAQGKKISSYNLQPVEAMSDQLLGPFEEDEELVLANDAAETQTVHLTAVNPLGATLCRADVTLISGAWYKRTLTEILPCANDDHIVLELRANQAGVAAMMLRFPKAGGAIPMYANPSPQVLLDKNRLRKIFEDSRKRIGLDIITPDHLVD